MSTEPARDPVTDRLLRHALQPQNPATSDGCVSAETLAAWADGGLPADQSADIEAHVAGCAHCQAVFGAFAQADASVTDSGAEAGSAPAVLPFTPKSPMRWVLPLAASIAATLLLWTAVRNRDAASVPDATMARQESTPAPRQTEEQFQRAAELAAPAAPAQTAQSAQLAEKRAAAPASSLSGMTGARANDASKASATPSPITPTGNPIAAPAPLILPPVQTTLAQPPPVPPATAGAQASRREVTMLRADTDPVAADAATAAAKVVAEFAPPASATPGVGRSFAGAGRGGSAAGAGGRSSALPAERATPRVRWRVLASGQVMKSTNDDTWVPVTITPTVFILNGHAPSPTVCWLVGRAGIVVLSTDATKFTRVMFPDVSDLRSITAIDAHQATVTTTDGRVFTTVDGGETWQLK